MKINDISQPALSEPLDCGSRLDEGLIQVPPRLLDRVMYRIATQILWFIRDRLKGKTKQYPEHSRVFKKFIRDTGIGSKLPKEPFRLPEDGMEFFRYPLDLIDMEPQYRKLRPKADSIRMVLDWKGRAIGANSKTAAGWLPDKHVLLVYLSSFETLQNYPGRSHPDDLSYILDTVEESVKHELRHAVQYLLLADKDPEQVRRKPAYRQHGADHWTSPLEFDPMIGTAVGDFLQQVRLITASHREQNPSYRMDIRKALESYTGIKPSRSRFDPFQTSDLFRHLKAVSPKRWKLAVNKFLNELKLTDPDLMIEPKKGRGPPPERSRPSPREVIGGSSDQFGTRKTVG